MGLQGKNPSPDYKGPKFVFGVSWNVFISDRGKTFMVWGAFGIHFPNIYYWILSVLNLPEGTYQK